MVSVLSSFIGPGISNRFCLVVAAWWWLATERTMTQIWSGPPHKCQTNRFQMTSFETWRGAWPKLDTQQGKHFFKQTHWKFTFVEAAFLETSYQLRARRVRKRASVENRVQTRILSSRDQNKFRQDWTRSNRFFGSRSPKKETYRTTLKISFHNRTWVKELWDTHSICDVKFGKETDRGRRNPACFKRRVKARNRAPLWPVSRVSRTHSSGT